MKQIQKIIKAIRHSKYSVSKQDKINDTNRYLLNNRRQYVAAAPVGFKSRTGSDFFLQ